MENYVFCIDDINNIPQEQLDGQTNIGGILTAISDTGSTKSIRVDNTSSFLGKIIARILNGITFSMDSFDSITLSNSVFNVINPENANIITLNNVNLKYDSHLLNSNNDIVGSFRFLDHNIEYRLTLTDEIIFNANLSNDPYSKILVSGYMENEIFKGFLKIEDKLLNLISGTYFHSLSYSNDHINTLNSQITLSNKEIILKDIEFTHSEGVIRGDFQWNFAFDDSFVKADLYVENMDITNYANQSINHISNVNKIDDVFLLNVFNNISRWRISKGSYFKARYIDINLFLDNITLYENNLNNAKISLLFDGLKNLYIKDTSLNFDYHNATVLGVLDLENKRGKLQFNSNGKAYNVLDSFSLPENWKNMYLEAFKQEDYFSLNYNMIFDSNKLYINDIKGSLGDNQIENIEIAFLQNASDVSTSIDIKLDKLTFNSLENIYYALFSSVSSHDGRLSNATNMLDKLRLNFNLYVDRFDYHGLMFNDMLMDFSVSKEGLNTNQIRGKGEHGGDITASIIADVDVYPMVFGFINFENYLLKLEETNNLFLSNHEIIGDMLINGRLRFNGDNFTDYASRIDAEISFIKNERVRINRLANTSYNYFTITQSSKNKKLITLVNDAYGTIKIDNNIINMSPIIATYFLDSKEYRGQSSLYLNIFEKYIHLSGKFDEAKNTNNSMVFDLEGDLNMPLGTKEFISVESIPVAPSKNEENVSQSYDNNYSVVDGLNNTDDPSNFNNQYNRNIKKNEEDIADKIFEKSLPK